MDLLERYNKTLYGSESDTVRLLNQVIDASFNRLIRRVRIQLRSTRAQDRATRNMIVLRELRSLIPVSRPDQVDAYDRLLTKLFNRASTMGNQVAEALSTQAGFSPPERNISASVPIEATRAAVDQARGYLTKHGQQFATTASEIVAKGVLEGRDMTLVTSELQQRLGVVKSRSETIVRTETLRAYNSASNSYYANLGISEVMWYATADSRTCSICVPRAGNIYKRGEVSVPAHPRCRCFLAPWDPEIAANRPVYELSRLTHRREVLRDFQKAHPESVPNKAAVFEQAAPIPIPSAQSIQLVGASSNPFIPKA